MDLSIYLSNRCNLLCHYCPIQLNQGGAAYLSAEEIARGVDLYMARLGGGRGNILFQGGEPFLRFGVLLEAVERIRRAHPSVQLHVFTNGTLLTRERLELLDQRRVIVTVSLDGDKAANDAHRVFYKRPGASVHDKVWPVAKELSDGRLRVNLVLSPATAPRLTAGLEEFRRAGFEWITFFPETWGGNGRAEEWKPGDLRLLQASLDDFKGYYARLVRGGERLFKVPHLFPEALTEGTSALGSDCDMLHLGPDGHFYHDAYLMGFPAERRSAFRIGHCLGTVDWEKGESLRREARRSVAAELGGRTHFTLINAYHTAVGRGRPPGPILRRTWAVLELYRRTFAELFESLKGEGAFRAVYLDGSAGR